MYENVAYRVGRFGQHLNRLEHVRLAIPYSDVRVVGAREQQRRLGVESDAVDARRVAGELANNAARRHIPQEHRLVAANRRQFRVVVRAAKSAHERRRE